MEVQDEGEGGREGLTEGGRGLCCCWLGPVHVGCVLGGGRGVCFCCCM